LKSRKGALFFGEEAFLIVNDGFELLCRIRGEATAIFLQSNPERSFIGTERRKDLIQRIDIQSRTAASGGKRGIYLAKPGLIKRFDERAETLLAVKIRTKESIDRGVVRVG
jgi:hypothetical protein